LHLLANAFANSRQIDLRQFSLYDLYRIANQRFEQRNSLIGLRGQRGLEPLGKIRRSDLQFAKEIRGVLELKSGVRNPIHSRQNAE